MSTAKLLIKRNSMCCLKTQIFFSQSEHRDRLDPCRPLVGFRSLFKSLHPPSPALPALSQGTLYLNKSKEAYRHKKKIYKEEMKRVHDNASAFMHLNINTNK